MFPPENSIYWRHIGLHLKHRQFDVGDYTYCAVNQNVSYPKQYWRHSVVSSKHDCFEAIMPMCTGRMLEAEIVELVIHSRFTVNDVVRARQLLALRSEYNLPVTDYQSFERLLVLEKLTQDENHD